MYFGGEFNVGFVTLCGLSFKFSVYFAVEWRDGRMGNEERVLWTFPAAGEGEVEGGRDGLDQLGVEQGPQGDSFWSELSE